jgi:hypothetical protein
MEKKRPLFFPGFGMSPSFSAQAEYLLRGKAPGNIMV